MISINLIRTILLLMLMYLMGCCHKNQVIIFEGAVKPTPTDLVIFGDDYLFN